MPVPNVLISGSGIAGAVFASCLLRAYPDATITIVERSPSLRLTGASVDIRSSAVDIIKWMGVEPEIRENTTKEEGTQFVNQAGKPIATFRATGRTDIQAMTSEYEIFRGKLGEIFLRPVLDRVEIIYGETVESYEELEDGINVRLTGTQTVRKYDILVAADGLGSRIRGMMLNSKPRDQIVDEGVHVAFFTIKKDLLEGDRLSKWYNTTEGRAIFLRPDPDPAGRTRGHFMNITPKGDAEAKSRFDTAISEGNDEYKKLVEESFRDAGWMAPEVLQGMRDSEDFYCSLFAQVRSPKLHSGRVVLLGDAGYATPGIGTSLAIIGGYVLAGEMLRNDGDIVGALQKYDQLMKRFVKTQQGDMGGAMRAMNPQTSWGLAARNAVLSFIDYTRLAQIMIYGAAMLGIKEKMVDLPEYPWPA